jgi:hypothetical protein
VLGLGHRRLVLNLNAAALLDRHVSITSGSTVHRTNAIPEVPIGTIAKAL